jgi:hypothetical protein
MPKYLPYSNEIVSSDIVIVPIPLDLLAVLVSHNKQVLKAFNFYS